MSIRDAEQGERDQRVLREIIAVAHDLTANECEAFEGMLDTLEAGRFPTLTARQRKWANDVAQRVHVEPSEGPEDDAPQDTRFTSGTIPRGREVASLVKGIVKCPPGRR
jgi:hypothetical protein